MRISEAQKCLVNVERMMELLPSAAIQSGFLAQMRETARVLRDNIPCIEVTFQVCFEDVEEYKRERDAFLIEGKDSTTRWATDPLQMLNYRHVVQPRYQELLHHSDMESEAETNLGKPNFFTNSATRKTRISGIQLLTN